MFKVGQVTFYLILYIHLVCCGWWYTTKQNEIWIPPMNIIDEKTEV